MDADTAPSTPKGEAMSSVDRIPRGRSKAPIPPIPRPHAGRTQSLRRQSGMSLDKKVVLVPKDDFERRRNKPIPPWKANYYSFSRQIKSNLFVPLTLILAVVGAGFHLTAVTGATSGYFSWSLYCEKLVSANEDTTNTGNQEYYIGWAAYKGVGPGSANALNKTVDAGNGTAIAAAGSGVAGSTIAQSGPLADIDAASAALGGVTAAVHLLGAVVYSSYLAGVIWLFENEFRSKRPVFRAAAGAAASLFFFTVFLAGIGFYFSIQKSFTTAVYDTLEDERFLCSNTRNLNAKYAYVATGFACVIDLAFGAMAIYYARAADKSLTARLERRLSLGSIRVSTTSSSIGSGGSGGSAGNVGAGRKRAGKGSKP